jgi:hypothetical protein
MECVKVALICLDTVLTVKKHVASEMFDLDPARLVFLGPAVPMM